MLDKFLSGIYPLFLSVPCASHKLTPQHTHYRKINKLCENSTTPPARVSNQAPKNRAVTRFLIFLLHNLPFRSTSIFNNKSIKLTGYRAGSCFLSLQDLSKSLLRVRAPATCRNVLFVVRRAQQLVEVSRVERKTIASFRALFRKALGVDATNHSGVTLLMVLCERWHQDCVRQYQDSSVLHISAM